MIPLSRHSFEEWAWQVLDFTQIYREVCFAKYEMVFIDLFVFIANIWEFKNSKMLFFK